MFCLRSVLLVLLVTVRGFLSLKFIKLDIPGALISGEPLVLDCQYDVEADKLYSVKWYKNNEEFYRYLPHDQPSGQKFELLGVDVDLSQSNESHVYLPNTDLNTEGVFACEVSADAPSFRTFRVEKEMRVYVLPQNGPAIEGLSVPFNPGDELNLTCTSGPAKPAPFLTWYLNGKEVEQKNLLRYPTIRHPDGLQTSKLQLNLPVLPSHLWGGVLKVQCLASISQIYARNSDEFVVGETTLPSAPSAGEEGPSITGGRKWYNVNDIVEINCTSPKSTNAAELRWYINDQEASPQQLLNYPPTLDRDGFQMASLGLKFRMQKHHLRNTELRLKCTVALSKIIRMSSEEIIITGSVKESVVQNVASSTQPAIFLILLVTSFR